MNKRTRNALPLLVGLALGACSTTPADTRPSCTAIMAACHPVDFGPGDVHDCHENSESLWSESQCQSNSSRCAALCVAPADAGPEAAADAGEGG